jgi:leucyl aminopeptidase
MEAHNLPVYQVVEEGDYNGNTYSVLTRTEHELVPEALREAFLADGTATHAETKTTYLTPEKAAKTTISASVRVAVSSGSADSSDYLGSISDFLSSAYKFSRKSKQPTPPTVSLLASVPLVDRLVDLVRTRNQTREWGNGRGDVEGTPQFFRAIAEGFAKETGVAITVISGDELLKEGFRLLHAVGRASKNEPVFVNLSYQGDPDCSEWVAFVGKGVCFDSGGLDIKSGTRGPMQPPACYTCSSTSAGR